MLEWKTDRKSMGISCLFVWYWNNVCFCYLIALFFIPQLLCMYFDIEAFLACWYSKAF